LIQKSRILLKIWTLLFEKVVVVVVVAVAVALELLQQSDSDPFKQFTIVRIAAADLPRFQLSL